MLSDESNNGRASSQQESSEVYSSTAPGCPLTVAAVDSPSESHHQILLGISDAESRIENMPLFITLPNLHALAFQAGADAALFPPEI